MAESILGEQVSYDDDDSVGCDTDDITDDMTTNDVSVIRRTLVDDVRAGQDDDDDEEDDSVDTNV